MKRILSFNEYSLSLALSESELENYFYVIEGLNENVNEGVIDRLKTIAKKGVLTATVLSTLMGNPTFAKEYKGLDADQKSRIENMITSSGEDKESEKSKYLNVGGNFGSGEYMLSDKQKTDIKKQLKDLLDQAKRDGTDFVLTVEASESKVPNKDLKTKEYLKEGELSKRRANSVQQVIKDFVASEGKNYTSMFVINPVNTDVIKNSEKAEWNKSEVSKLSKEELLKMVNSEKYTKHQFVRIFVERGSGDKKTPCNLKLSEEGSEAPAEVNYISLDVVPVLDVKNMYGSGGVVLNPGEIPDRVVLLADYKADPKTTALDTSKVIADSGYKAGFEHRKHTNWKYIPAHVLKLTELRMTNSSATMDTEFFKAKIVTKGKDFNTFDELVKLMLKNQNYDYVHDSAARTGEIGGGGSSTGPLVKLKNMFNKGQKEFMFYEVEGGSEKNPNSSIVDYVLDGSYKTITVVVYSPLGKTQYKLEGVCGIKN